RSPTASKRAVRAISCQVILDKASTTRYCQGFLDSGDTNDCNKTQKEAEVLLLRQIRQGSDSAHWRPGRLYLRRMRRHLQQDPRRNPSCVPRLARYDG